MKKIVFVAQSNGGVAEYLYMFLKNSKDNDEYEKYLVVSNQYKEQEERFEKYVKNIYYVDMTRNMSFSKDLKSIVNLKKVIKEIKPDFVIVVDALKASNVDRVNKTIQITDAGINPGSGIGNTRKEISKDVLNIPVFAVGVPTVVDTVTIVNDVYKRQVVKQVELED